MDTTYLARLTFLSDAPSVSEEAQAEMAPDADDPRVEGEWTVLATARDRYTKWSNLYGRNPAAVVQLISRTDGQEHVLQQGTTQGEVTSEGT
ncbi:hypothetical protein ACFZAV_16995 [Streptomyces sp. NPDC008343]|uniref:hypothetical protein n=1 Tax=Streptomyces sp. NPDC008343 TaxID=3364828 RepID=UPI0036F0AC53